AAAGRRAVGPAHRRGRGAREKTRQARRPHRGNGRTGDPVRLTRRTERPDRETAQGVDPGPRRGLGTLRLSILLLRVWLRILRLLVLRLLVLRILRSGPRHLIALGIHALHIGVVVLRLDGPLTVGRRVRSGAGPRNGAHTGAYAGALVIADGGAQQAAQHGAHGDRADGALIHGLGLARDLRLRILLAIELILLEHLKRLVRAGQNLHGRAHRGRGAGRQQQGRQGEEELASLHVSPLMNGENTISSRGRACAAQFGGGSFTWRNCVLQFWTAGK